VRKDRVAPIDWLQDKLAEAGGTIPQIKGPITRQCRAGLAFLGKRAQTYIREESEKQSKEARAYVLPKGGTIGPDGGRAADGPSVSFTVNHKS
jgi:hypothetical protein